MDAPTIAVLWCWFFAAAQGVRLRAASLVALGIAVWILYALDRLLDARRPSDALQERHLFHHRHRIAFTAGILLGGLILATLLPRVLADVRGAWLILAIPLGAHLALIHRSHKDRPKPKELAVAVFFCAACALPATLRTQHPALVLPGALLFAAICWLNCIAIARWEPPSPDAHPTTLWSERHLPHLCLLTAAAALLAALAPQARTVAATCALSALLLFVLDRGHHRLRPLTLRALADAALATPLLYLVLHIA